MATSTRTTGMQLQDGTSQLVSRWAGFALQQARRPLHKLLPYVGGK